MKLKTISAKTKSASRLIDEIKDKGKNLKSEKAKTKVEALISNYEKTIGIKKEVELLKRNLKVKLGEIEESVKKLLKSRKGAKKALKNSKIDNKKQKNIAPDKKGKVTKPASKTEKKTTDKAASTEAKVIKKVAAPKVKAPQKKAVIKTKATHKTAPK